MSSMSSERGEHIEVSNWLHPSRPDAVIAVWPAETDADAMPQLRGRVTVIAHTGAAHVQLHPTREECRALAAALLKAAGAGDEQRGAPNKPAVLAHLHAHLVELQDDLPPQLRGCA